MVKQTLMLHILAIHIQVAQQSPFTFDSHHQYVNKETTVTATTLSPGPTMSLTHSHHQ